MAPKVLETSPIERWGLHSTPLELGRDVMALATRVEGKGSCITPEPFAVKVTQFLPYSLVLLASGRARRPPGSLTARDCCAAEAVSWHSAHSAAELPANSQHQLSPCRWPTWGAPAQLGL